MLKFLLLIITLSLSSISAMQQRTSAERERSWNNYQCNRAALLEELAQSKKTHAKKVLSEDEQRIKQKNAVLKRLALLRARHTRNAAIIDQLEKEYRLLSFPTPPPFPSFNDEAAEIIVEKTVSHVSETPHSSILPTPEHSNPAPLFDDTDSDDDEPLIKGIRVSHYQLISWWFRETGTMTPEKKLEWFKTFPPEEQKIITSYDSDKNLK